MTALSFLDREHTIAPPGYSRWLIPPAALAVHMCIGQVYATSVYKSSLIADFGASEKQIGYIFSLAIVMLGLSAAVFGTWVDLGGPRRAMFTSACCWTAGFLVAALGITTGQLWLVYLGYGFIGGIGLGIGYISPVSTLMKWFPDRPGLATGMAIMGFGGGAMIASPLSTTLLSRFGTGSHPLKPDGSPNLTVSIYDADTVAKLFVTLGLAYFVVMMFGVFTVRVPAPGWHPVHWDPALHKPKAMQTTAHVSATNAIKTPQFWLLWVVLLCNVTAGIGILENAAPMIQDFFRNEDGSSELTSNAANVGLVAAGFVGLLSIFNMGGRFVWSTVSDIFGRKVNYVIYLGVGTALYFVLASVGSSSVAVFVLICAIILSFYGGGFATAPAYLRDLFGTFQVGAIHGRLLTAWSAAGVLGPLIVNGILDHAAEGKPCKSVVNTVTNETVKVCPVLNGKIQPGFLDAGDYRLAMLIMVGVLIVGFVANLLIRPVNAKFHERGPVVDAVDAAH
jgi:MFS family permease